MRVALISDLHANAVALGAVLADLKTAAPDQVVCLGDVAATGPQPREVVAALRDLNPLCVMGNTDAFLLNPVRRPEEPERYRRFTDMDLWCASQLDSVALGFISSFQPTVALPLSGDARLLAYHGSPRSYDDLIRVTTPDAELASMFEGQGALVYAGGHTHQPFVRRFGAAFLINPGSVGLAFEVRPDGTARNAPWAEYALIDVEATSVWVNLRRVPFDETGLVRATLASGMPHADWWAHELRF